MTTPDETEPELIAEEARDLADDLGLQLYRAQDALAFVEECCVIADREGGGQVTTGMVREWLKGARCGRQLAADHADETAPALLFWDTSDGASLADGRITISVSRAASVAEFTPAGHLILQVPAATALRAKLTSLLNDAFEAQHNDEAPDRIVAYRLAGQNLRCIACTPSPRGDIWEPVISDDLPDGGVCAQCHIDVLIPQDVPRREPHPTQADVDHAMKLLARLQGSDVQHEPGKAVLCPDCRDKGRMVCVDDRTQATPPAGGAPHPKEA